MNKIFFKNARLVDGTGVPAVENATLVFEKPDKATDKGHILYAGANGLCPLTPTPADEIADLAGYTVLPGIFDCHVHLWMTSQKPLFKADHMGVPMRTAMYYRNVLDSLVAGVTTLRTCGSSDNIDIALRDCIEQGRLWGTRIVACGSPIEPHGGHCHITWGTIECSGTAEFMKAVRVQMGEGADFIKLMYTGGAGGGSDEAMFGTHFTDEEAAAVCNVVHMRGKKVAAHLSNDFAIRSALRAGVDSIEHAYTMEEDTARMMADQGAYYVPTMGVTANSFHYPTEALNEHFKRVMGRLRAAHPAHQQAYEYALKHNVKICCGTDSVPSVRFQGITSTYGEIMLLAEGGLPPLEAIKAATFNSAELCGLSDVTGSLQVGLAADITVFKGKPDQDIHMLDTLSMVAKEGQIVWSEVEGYKKPCQYGVYGYEGDPIAGVGGKW